MQPGNGIKRIRLMLFTMIILLRLQLMVMA